MKQLNKVLKSYFEILGSIALLIGFLNFYIPLIFIGLVFFLVGGFYDK